MKNILLPLIIFLSLPLAAQNNFQYVAVKTGLNMRDKPDLSGKVIGKIPYAEKIAVPDTREELKKINTEGLTGYWRMVSYNNKSGYILDSYLLPLAPPKAGIKSIKDYFPQISVPFGSTLIVKNGNRNNVEEGGYELHKQLYKNGTEWHQSIGYEYSSVTYFLPGFTMQEAFLLLRLVPEFSDIFGEKDEFPTENKTFKKGENEYTISIEKEMIGEEPWIKKIFVEFSSGAVYSFEMQQAENQIVVFYGSGV